MKRKAMIRKRYVRPVANRPLQHTQGSEQQTYRAIPDIRLLVIGVVLGILVMLIIFSSNGMLRDLLVALGIVSELAALHWLSISQG
jgi:hypothetical protein